MPSMEIDCHGVPAVAEVTAIFRDLLRHAETVKPTASIEPALEKSDFGDLQAQLSRALPKLQPSSPPSMRNLQYAVIETAARDMLAQLVATSHIESPEFVKVWNLLDLLSILADMEECDAALLFWLVEELLDSQTISGCRIIFDFLESRRQRIAAKHFKSKHLVILRSCNELLRRLSRARDTTFCGRVFIFMFQCFPLGDRSSVNLRGEYHVENVTTFDQDGAKRNGTSDKMDVDNQSNVTTPADGKQTPKQGSSSGKSQVPPVDADTLYPIFWSLQASFSQPKTLFDRKKFAEFQSGLQLTLNALEYAQSQASSRSKQNDGSSKTSQKRKRDAESDAFNPKYLTSRDLFELELSDLTFRRYILIQALIIMEFLLSLSLKAKERLSDLKTANKSVTYPDQVLTEEEAKWATDMKSKITTQLTSLSVPDGTYFFRVVGTVLARDRNWVRWKAESCPTIELPPVPPELFAEAKRNAHRHVNKKFKSMGGNTLALDFLSTSSDSATLESLKAADRHQLPELVSFKRKIQEDELEIDFASDSKSKAAAVEGKASKSWRALRIASRSRLAVFDKIDDPDKIDIVFDDNAMQQVDGDSGEAPGKRPEDTRPVVISGPPSVGKSSLIKMLLERNPRVFGIVPKHTTRIMKEGEAKPKDSISVPTKDFSTMIDGDLFLEFSSVEGEQEGTSRRAVETIVEADRVPLMEMSADGVRQSKDMMFAARHVFIRPPDMDVLGVRLKERGLSDDEVEAALKLAREDLEGSTAEGLYDEVIENTDLEVAYTALELFVYGSISPAQGDGDGDGEAMQT